MIWASDRSIVPAESFLTASTIKDPLPICVCKDNTSAVTGAGCGGITLGRIPKRKWVGGVSSCTDSGSGCIGCTEEVFPDIGGRGLYMHRMADSGIKNQMLNNDVTNNIIIPDGDV